MRRKITDAEGERLVQLARACVDYSLPREEISKNLLRLRRYCRRLMKRTSDGRVFAFMAISYDDPRKRLYWNEQHLRTNQEDFPSFKVVLLDLKDFDARLPATYARSVRRVRKLAASRKPVTRDEHALFFDLLAEMAEKLGRDSDAKRWNRISNILDKRGRYRLSTP